MYDIINTCTYMKSLYKANCLESIYILELMYKNIISCPKITLPFSFKKTRPDDENLV